MKISIHHSERSGGFLWSKRLHWVRLEVRLSEQERWVVRERGLGKYLVLKRGPPANREFTPEQLKELSFNLTVTDLLGVDEHCLATPSEAKLYEEQLRRALQETKYFIDDNLVAPTGVRRYKL